MAAINRNQKPHTIYLDDAEYAAVRAAAEAQGLNFTDFLRGLIERYVPDTPAPVSDRVAEVEQRLTAVERRLASFGLKKPEPAPAALAVDVPGEPARRARRTGNVDRGAAKKREE